MANVGALIRTPQGLVTVVKVVPGHVDPALSQVVTEPLNSGGGSSAPAKFHGSPLPGQSHSAANFVQTLILPTEGPSSTAGANSATASATTAGTTDMTAQIGVENTAPTTTTVSEPSQTAAEQNSAQAALPVPSFTQAATAYRATQQRASESTLRTLLKGSA